MANENKTFSLCNLSAEPGERISGELLLGNGEFCIPTAIFHGERPGKTVLVTAGIHAGEYVAIQTAIELSRRLQIEKVSGSIIILKVVNRPAFENRSGSMGLSDGKNLNRVFPGDLEGTETERLAYAISHEVFPLVDYYIDLHGGDTYEQMAPFVYYAGVAGADTVSGSRKMAEQVDVPYMVCSQVASGGAYNYAASIGIPSILIERGQMGGWELEEVQSTSRDVQNILSQLGIYQKQKDYRKYYPLEVEDVQYQHASHTGIWYPYKRVGDLVSKGEFIGEVWDYEGNGLELSWAEFDGVILYQTGSLQVLGDGPMVAYGRISRKMDGRKERIVNYWKKRSGSFLEQRRSELHSPLARRWMEEISALIPKGRKLKILDVGCGTGFFTILLSKEGHDAIGTDLTPEMVENARQLAKEEGESCHFQVMDAENLDFPDESFDLVISRNLTWTLPHAEQAYLEWQRVLKAGGVLLNFDANYGLSDFANTAGLPENHAHHTLGDQMMRECEEIKQQLPISAYDRPAWDLSVLAQMGMKQFTIDLDVSKRIYTVKDEFYNPTPLFILCAEKA